MKAVSLASMISQVAAFKNVSYLKEKVPVCHRAGFFYVFVKMLCDSLAVLSLTVSPFI